jgi:ParB family chromosome partitioning protein
VHHGISDEKAHEIAFTQNVVRKNLSPIEKANAIRLAKKRGCKPAAIAAEFGLSEKQLVRYEKLLDFPKQLQELVDEDEVSMAHAKVLVDFGVTEIVEWVANVQDKKWSATDLKRELRSASKKPATMRRQYINVRGDVLRVYGAQIRKEMQPDEKKRMIAAYKQVLKFLEA